MSLFKPRKKIISRGYDIAGAGFSPITTRLHGNIADAQEFTWNVGLAKDLLALFVSMALSSIAYGILMIMMATRMEEFVKNEVLISVSSATQIIAGIFFARFLPQMGKKIGITNSLYVGVLMSATSTLLMFFYVNFFCWLLVIFIFGCASFICGVTRQTIMIELAPKRLRALVVSFSGMLISLGNSFGPIFLQMLQTHDSFATFSIACSFFLAATLPLSRLKHVETHIREEKQISVWHYIFTSPKIMFAGFATNYTVSSISAFVVIYGIKAGMSKDEAAMLLSVFLFGSIFSLPISYLTNIFNRRLMMIGAAALSLLCFISLHKGLAPNEIRATIFAIFVFSISIKLPALMLINEKYKPTKRLAVNSSFSKFCLMGNVFGLFITGALMQVFGTDGLWLSCISILWLFLLFCALNYLQKFLRGELTRQDFSIFNKPIPDEKLL